MDKSHKFVFHFLETEFTVLHFHPTLRDTIPDWVAYFIGQNTFQGSKGVPPLIYFSSSQGRDALAPLKCRYAKQALWCYDLTLTATLKGHTCVLVPGSSRYAALPDSGRSPDEILGYDEHGLPT